MEVKAFIENYKEAFGAETELPLVFWYSDTPVRIVEKVGGCLFKYIQEVRNGEFVSLNADNIGCGGGKFYTGFADMPDYVPEFVSVKEKYRKTPEMVKEQLDSLRVPRTRMAFLNFARLDKIDSFDNLEALLFFAKPDVLSGLSTWAFFDNGAADSVAVPFGSGCCSTITRAVLENRKKGRSCILGFFDPSVRPYFEPDILSFTIPMFRFKEMYHTMRQSCLYDTHAWKKIKDRL
ncbi:DUF169 domain-containing protein [Parabacteroides provencensis]|uniref:DUF169 domain-containing protein n=1 Tax=Parabacteroides provencensis TaxID=1944636 RepID=UPI000C14E113|nr:DUF169 domain-containing protein [Parabacteroides provencensis]